MKRIVAFLLTCVLVDACIGQIIAVELGTQELYVGVTPTSKELDRWTVGIQMSIDNKNWVYMGKEQEVQGRKPLTWDIPTAFLMEGETYTFRYYTRDTTGRAYMSAGRWGGQYHHFTDGGVLTNLCGGVSINLPANIELDFLYQYVLEDDVAIELHQGLASSGPDAFKLEMPAGEYLYIFTNEYRQVLPDEECKDCLRIRVKSEGTCHLQNTWDND